MKTWIIALPFVCAASVAMAQGGAQPDALMPSAAPAATPAERAATQSRLAATPAVPAARDEAATLRESRAAEAPAAATTKRRAAKQGARSLPKGDVRHCLDRKTRAEVIRCSETRPRK